MTLTARTSRLRSGSASLIALVSVGIAIPTTVMAPASSAAPPSTPSALCNTAGKGGLITFPNTTTVRHVFTNAAAAEQFIAPNRDLTGVNVLLVGGGGGGGGGYSQSSNTISGGGGGGGGGQVVSTTLNFTKNVSYTVVVGDGGAGGTGSNAGTGSRGSPGIATSVAHAGGTATAAGGGGGGGAGGVANPATSRNGGSVTGGSGGGGAGWPASTGGPGSGGTGTRAGGAGQNSGTGRGAGGGGAGANGGVAIGGAGVQPAAPFNGTTYAGGGGGGGLTQANNGGSGGGGIGRPGSQNGDPGSTAAGVAGGGGGAGGNITTTGAGTTGGKGARGTVIIQYARTNACLTVTPTTPSSILPTLSWSPAPTVTPFTIASWTVLYSESPTGPWGVFANGGTAAQVSLSIQSTASARFASASACTSGQALNSGWTCRFTRGVPSGTIYFSVFARLTGGGVTKLSAPSAPVALSVG